MKVVILKKGLHSPKENVSEEYSRRIDPICSSVTLIKAEKPEEKNILVDTGYYGYEEEILDALKLEGLLAEDIDYIINTHEHFDHCANNYLFRNAKKIIDLLQWNPEKNIDVFNSHDSIRIQEGVSIMDTPGHKKPHCSVVVEAGGKTYVIAGDIIAKKFVIHPFETEEKIESALKVLNIADIIIPGHGPIIEKKDFPQLKEEIKKTSGGLY